MLFQSFSTRDDSSIGFFILAAASFTTGDEIYVPIFNEPTGQESRMWTCKYLPTPTMMKKQRTIENGIYALFFRSTELMEAKA